MSREIKFRGKDPNGKWFYGDLCQVAHKRFIDDDRDRARVHPDSIGQFIGHKDADGTEVYENDVLEHVITEARYKVVWDRETVAFVLQGEAVTLSANKFRFDFLRVVKEESHEDHTSPPA